ncbi:MAG: primosomal protein N' [Prevotella sp.]|nr:primosomal protein N' [Candidatus Prevotella equi]
MLFVDVILPLPLDGLFTYSVPAALEGAVRPFVRAKVPFGLTKTHTALIVRVHDVPPQSDITVKDIISVLDDNEVLLPEQYKLWEWISSYYMSPLGDIMKAALPQGLKKEGTYRARTETYVNVSFGDKGMPDTDDAVERCLHAAIDSLQRSPKQQEVFLKFLEVSGWENGAQEKEITREELINAAHCTTAIIKALVDRGALRLYDKEVGRLNNAGMPHPKNIKPLSIAQQEALDKLAENTSLPIGRERGITLLHGVTSSGKTEIYIQLIQQAIDRGEQVMYLLPEIALTVQITQRLQHVFGNRLGIYHSKYSDAERVEIWQKQLSDSPYDVILGARSAVFLPYKRLGLVIIDEEHETSFKQQDPSPRYHARSVAMMMARWCGAAVVLGTATPSAESYYNALSGKYRLVTLTKRYKDLQLPNIQVVDVKDLRHRKIMRGMLSPQLKEAVAEALQNGEQVILFQNRRGFSPVVECHQCGWTPRCPNCDVSLTYHKMMGALTCHYCGHTYRMPAACPDCKNTDLRDRGAGTEKIEDIIAETFPSARIARMDLDTTHTRNAYERIIAEFSAGKTNLLIGTQMVTKGLDFDNVSVVGILSADTMLNQPDFRAYEHAFMMMTQVAGRAGRKGRRGTVILQTTHPGLPVVKQIVSNDYKGFFRSLMEERQMFHYPPFTRLIDIYLKHKDDNTVNTAAIELGGRLRPFFGERLLGPDKPSVARVKALCIRKIVLKIEPQLSITQVRQSIRQAVAGLMQDQRYKSLMISFDVDPL